jgi:hypothetical protein
MDGIQTRVYCPECGSEVELLLEKQEMEQLSRLMEMLNLPLPGRENAYKGGIKCSCGKTIQATFVIEASSEDERRGEIIISGGVL